RRRRSLRRPPPPRCPPPPRLPQPPPLAAPQPIREIVHLLLPLPDRSHDPAKSSVLRQFRQRLSPHQHAVTHRAFQPLMQRRSLILHSLPRPDHQLRRRRWCRRTQVSNEIQNREIRLVPHRRNHRNFRSCHRARQRLITKRRQIFRRPSPPRHHNNFHPPLATNAPHSP